MIPRRFLYHAPADLREAIRLLSDDPGAKVLAGGQSLLPLMKLRLTSPSALVDISKIRDLAYVRDESDHLSIGALTTHDRIEHSQVIGERFAMVADAVSGVGDQQVRNRGTIGGSVCHADPAGDLPTALLSADARFIIEDGGQDRVVPVEEFFIDPFKTALKHAEILREIRLPYLPPNSASAFTKHTLREADRAVALVGCSVSLNDDSKCGRVRIGIGGVGAKPTRAEAAEEYLVGKALDDLTMAETAERAVEDVDPISDIRGSREYRLEVVKVLTRRTLRTAVGRLRSETSVGV